MSDRATAPDWLIRRVDELMDRMEAIEKRLAAGHEVTTLAVVESPAVATQTESPR